MTKKTERPLTEAGDLHEIADANRQSMQTVLKSYNAWLENACRVQTEMLKFINKRVREDMEVPARFAQCRNPADIVEHQVSFASTMFQDYADESQKMLDLMAEAAYDVAGETDAPVPGQRQN